MEGQASEQPSIEQKMLGFLAGKGDIQKIEDEEPLKEPLETVSEPPPIAVPTEEQPETDSEPVEEEGKPKYRFTVKNDLGLDEEVEMTPEEMQKSVMLERDYRRKTAELARTREQFQDEIRKGFEAERQQYLQNLEVVQQAFLKTVAPEFDGLNLSKLAEEDPAQYVKMTNRVNQVQTVLKAIQDEQAKVIAQQQEEHKATLQKQVAEAREVLLRDIPTWSDELYEDTLKTTMNAYGFKPEEVNAVVDPRIVKLMHDAAQYQKLKGTKSIVDKKVAQAPKVVKPGQASEKVDQSALARQALKKSGKTDDFVAFLKAKNLKV